MEKIRVDVAWCNKNFSAQLGDNVPGAVVFTANTPDELYKEAKETLEFHVQGMLEDGDEVPQWLVDGDYEFEYHYVNVAALIRICEPLISIAALSRATGINQHQLSHYANGIKNPRPHQRQRIVDGIHRIGQQLITVV